VAARAQVGIGALYHRYASKEELLRTLCRNGQLIYLAEARQALDSGGDPWQAFTGFPRRIVAANTHGLTVRLAGTFEPTADAAARKPAHLARADRTLDHRSWRDGDDGVAVTG
jgi:AcrR family transcriptional regulator